LVDCGYEVAQFPLLEFSTGAPPVIPSNLSAVVRTKAVLPQTIRTVGPKTVGVLEHGRPTTV